MDWTGYNISSEPVNEPLSLTELKLFMHLDSSSFDSMLTGFIIAARQAIEKSIKRSLITKTMNLYFDSFPCYSDYPIELIYPPVQSVTSITYTDTDGVLQTWNSSKYAVDLFSLYPRITPSYGESYPVARSQLNSVKITYVAGYGSTSSSVPAPIKECIKSLCNALFENPEANLEVKLTENQTYKFLLNAYKIDGVG